MNQKGKNKDAKGKQPMSKGNSGQNSKGTLKGDKKGQVDDPKRSLEEERIREECICR
jgi:hypothetical protein